MDAYSIHGGQYYQGYPVQAPPPGTASNQTLPPGAVPAQPAAPTSTPLAPPGVAPPPSSTAASYYGTYAPPSYGYPPPSAERWSSYPIPPVEPPHPYASYPPTVPYDRPGYGHHPYHQQDPFLHAHSFPSPPQTYMPLPPRGSDVTRFRKKRPFLPHQNLRPKNKPFKQPQENSRGGGKNSQQVKRAFDSDPRAFNVANNGFPVANNVQTRHPFWQGRIEDVPANRTGKKRRTDERGEGRPSRNDDRRKGDKRARPGWNKGKRKKGRKQGGDKSSMDPDSEAQGTSPLVKSVDAVPVIKVQAQETAIWSELHRDVRRRVQEFLHTSERETLQKRGIQDTQEVAQKGAGGDGNAVVQEYMQESTINAVGGDANADIEDTQARSQEAAGGVANAETQDTQKEVGGDANADIEDTQAGSQEAAGGVANAETQDTQKEVGGDANAEMRDIQEAADGDLNAEMQGKEEAVHADANAKPHMAKNDAAAQIDYVNAQQADNTDSSQAEYMGALPSDCTEQQQLDQKFAARSDSADLLLARAHVDAVQSEEPHADEDLKKLDIVDILKTDCESARLATEIIQDLEIEDVQECPGVDEVKSEHNNEQPLLKTDKKHGKYPQAPKQDESKERELKTFKFFTKLFEENKDLRNMYIQNCNNGAFECLMCHSKIKKRFSNLVSLVTHASNVLKTKKLPEHRGYGRAVCALLGWDPQKYPKVPKSQVSHSGVENAPGDDAGDGDVCAPVGNAIEHAHAADAVENALQVDAVKGAAVVSAAESKLRGDVDESALRGEADQGVYAADAVEGEPVGDADGMEPRGEVDDCVPLGDADECTPLKDTSGSIKQESVRDRENIVDQGGISKEHTKELKEQEAMVSEEVAREHEGRNEQVEEVDMSEVPTSSQAGGAEVVQYSAEV